MEIEEDTLSNTLNSVSPDKLDAMKDDFYKDLKESGDKHVAAANKFQAGLDSVVNVLLILVLKFGRATAMLLAIGLLLVVNVVTLIVTTVQVVTVRTQVKDLMDRQEEFARSQRRIEKTTNATQEQVTTTDQKVSETQAKVETAVEASPKVEVDAKTGKAKLVVAIPPKPKAASGFGSSKAAPAPSGRKVILNLE